MLTNKQTMTREDWEAHQQTMCVRKNGKLVRPYGKWGMQRHDGEFPFQCGPVSEIDILGIGRYS